MKKVYNMILLAASTSVLFACGSGGSGSGATGTTTGTSTGGTTGGTSGGTTGGGTTGSSTTTPLTSYTTISNYPSNRVRTDDHGTFTYYNAITQQTISLNTPGITSGGIYNQNTADSRLALGGTGYSYSRFGAYALRQVPTWSTDWSSITDIFSIGDITPISGMPTTGTATYKGFAVSGKTSGNVSSAMTFNVDFGAHTISGQTNALVADFGREVSLSAGTISGNTFSGIARSNAHDGIVFNGSYSGRFYGPAAQELGGTAEFNNPTQGFAFGGQK